MNTAQQQMLINAQGQPHRLTKWENDFVDSLVDRNETIPNFELSDRQNETLDRIQRKLD